ncbi:ATP-binding cassette domain-containing protein [Phycicoccus sp. MAQZ13P-2]|uniref:ABC transporter ATP-binding protein n=1 Tax=Phycicoccus mangrovi TaxID=2840470 RepID=UPI001C003CC6|nr:oligopeptide/dipeptide ABC transporter ATP-binding protein [Phycicoccus mangrovi]MBT9254722.1 ATP-binding cassette domain-containing protein [Phycicoccus mangrovi]MBT9273073.1 ATP-binding cassette domain-containing protein [Phycicoccus mangrovi]
MNSPLLEARGLSRHYALPRSARQWLGRRAPRTLRAVDEVDLSVERGRTLGIVGETGSGKSTLGRLLLQLERADAGQVLVDGVPATGPGADAGRRRRRDIQVVLQDPYTSLNPYLTIGSAIEEVLTVGGMTSRDARRERVGELLEQVGFPAEWAERKPGQLSGGGRQRVSIARALAAEPRLIVADEPVSALDVSVQAQVLNLFQRLQRELGLAYVFITHDLAVLERIADEVVVLYLGRVVERGPADKLFAAPKHPYTQALLAAAPSLGRSRSTSSVVAGELPDPASPPPGCTFHTRCPFVMEVCRTTRPRLTTTGEGQQTACHLHADPAPASLPPTDGRYRPAPPEANPTAAP